MTGTSPAAEPGGGPADEDGVTAHLIVDCPLDDSLVVDGHDGHHLQRVRRVRAFEHVTVADGAGGWRRYAVRSATRGVLHLDAVGVSTIEPPGMPLCVAPALTKDAKLETVVAQLTELGVTEVAPLVAERSVVRLDEAALVRLGDRGRAAARASSMQSRRARVPVVHAPGSLASISTRADLLVAIRGGLDPWALGPPGISGFTVATGPEGGFSDAERAQLAAAGARELGLGRFVLRAQHAPLVAAAALLTRQSV